MLYVGEQNSKWGNFKQSIPTDKSKNNKPTHVLVYIYLKAYIQWSPEADLNINQITILIV